MDASERLAVHASAHEGLYEAGVLLALLEDLKPTLEQELAEHGIKVDYCIRDVSGPTQSVIRRLGLKALRLRLETGGWVEDTQKRKRSA
jgi:hypothetical protein